MMAQNGVVEHGENVNYDYSSENEVTETSEILEAGSVEVTFQDLASLRAVFSFSGVVDVLCEACEQLKWKIPSKIQQEAIPLALKGKEHKFGK
ncbi:hypothetical protein PR048_018329 [Dryococelus australis]|uniref:RNA helicase n=1 Tax=Dryococelus australis TaxID=614101 RepID=A0ABQ9HCP7_9NEOP|nr:hypothetical protein PR048_018329 [Dryococelus australis]